MVDDDPSEDITEDVLVAAEGCSRWYQEYQQISADLGQAVVNCWIGRYTKDVTGMDVLQRSMRATWTTLIRTYTRLTW